MSFTDYIEERLSFQIVSGGSQFLLEEDCPFCGGHGKIYVDLKKEVGICFRCSQGFSGLKFVAAREGVSFAKAARLLGGESDRYESTHAEEEDAPTTAWYPPCEPLSGAGLDYMIDRGFGLEFCDRMGLMYCSQNVKLPDGKVYWTSGRVIVFIRNRLGEVVSWVGRDITGRSKIKYLFQPGFKASENLYGIENASPEEPLIVVEGVMDAWGWVKAGFGNVVATFGKKISNEQLAQVVALQPEAVYIAWDGDASWEKAQFAERYGHIFSVKIIEMKEKDADELEGEQLLELYSRAVDYSWENKIIAALGS
jgi:DNA primase